MNKDLKTIILILIILFLMLILFVFFYKKNTKLNKNNNISNKEQQINIQKGKNKQIKFEDSTDFVPVKDLPKIK